MKQDDFFKIIGIIIVCFFIIYMSMKLFQIQTNIIEGLTNADGTISSTVNSPASGEAGTAASYAASIKAQVVKLQDELLIAKYRTDYEAAIINLDDLIGYMMIKQSLNININNDTKTIIEMINQLNIMKDAKESLNTTMAFLDNQ